MFVNKPILDFCCADREQRIHCLKLCVMRLCDGADLEVGLSTRTVSDMQVSVIHHD